MLSLLLLSYFPDPVARTLAESRTVARFLKGLDNLFPKAAKMPVWSLDDAIAKLDTYFFDYSSLYEVSCHLATMLLLFSGHRVSELQFLAIDADHMQITDDSLVFQPLHGTKTDNTNVISEPWIFPDNVLFRLSVTRIVQHFLTLSESIRGDCTHLFLDTLSVGKPASLAKLRNMVAKTLPKLGVLASPGTVRSAYATSHLLAGLNIDDLLKRGLWKRPETVRNHYFRP